MKTLKYALILASMIISGALFAQDNAPAKSDGVKVSSRVENGVITLVIEGSQDSKFVSCDDTLKDIVTRALSILGPKTQMAKAVEAAVAAVKANLKDPKAPSAGKIFVQVQVYPDQEKPIVDVKTDIQMAGERYQADTKSTIADDGSVTTTGKVVVTDQQGVSKTSPVDVATKPSGDIVAQGPQGPVSEKSQGQLPVAEAPSVSDSDASVTMPDNTIVSSESK